MVNAGRVSANRVVKITKKNVEAMWATRKGGAKQVPMTVDSDFKTPTTTHHPK